VTVRYHRRVVIAGLLLIAIVLMALLAPVLATHDPRHAVPEEQFQGPSAQHLLGTDHLGRDVFSRVLYGGRRALALAGLALLVIVPAGGVIGALAGSDGRWLDMGLMVLVDALLSFPGLLLALALVAVFGTGLVQIAIAVGIAGIGSYARVVRAAVLEARTREFVAAARAVGAGPVGIFWRHILPTATPTLLAFASVALSWALLNGAALAFLGYAGDISAPDWGVMLAQGRATFRTAPWGVLAPGAALSVLVGALNLLASGLGRRNG
jgi:peptide/nickel transport system permease protein